MASGSSEDVIRSWASVQETLGGAKKRAMRALISEYMALLKEPAEGFTVKVEDPFNWEVGIYGPPSTPYWGGYFKLHVSFPDEYPFEPPKLTFRSRFWHPNVYQNGVVCMSILHDPQSEDVPSDLPTEEKWNPTLSVRTVLLSLISIIGTPNPDSPANVDATKMYRSWVEGEDDSYYRIVQDIVSRSKRTAERDGVRIPKTLEEYLRKPEPDMASLVDYQNDDSDCDYDSSEALSSPSSSGSDKETYLDAESEPKEMTTVDLNTFDDHNRNKASTSNGNSATIPIIEESQPFVKGCSSTDTDIGRNQITIESHHPTSSQNNDVENRLTDSNSSSMVRNDQEGADHAPSSRVDLSSTASQQLTSSSNTRKRRPPRLFLFHSKSDNKKRRRQ